MAAVKLKTAKIWAPTDVGAHATKTAISLRSARLLTATGSQSPWHRLVRRQQALSALRRSRDLYYDQVQAASWVGHS